MHVPKYIEMVVIFQQPQTAVGVHQALSQHITGHIAVRGSKEWDPAEEFREEFEDWVGSVLSDLEICRAKNGLYTSDKINQMWAGYKAAAMRNKK